MKSKCENTKFIKIYVSMIFLVNESYNFLLFCELSQSRNSFHMIYHIPWISKVSWIYKRNIHVELLLVIPCILKYTKRYWLFSFIAIWKNFFAHLYWKKMVLSIEYGSTTYIVRMHLHNYILFYLNLPSLLFVVPKTAARADIISPQQPILTFNNYIPGF